MFLFFIFNILLLYAHKKTPDMLLKILFLFSAIVLENYTSGGTEGGEPSPPWRIKIVMAYLRIILKDESHTVGNSPLRCSSDIKPYIPTYQPIQWYLYIQTTIIINSLFRQ